MDDILSGGRIDPSTSGPSPSNKDDRSRDILLEQREKQEQDAIGGTQFPPKPQPLPPIPEAAEIAPPLPIVPSFDFSISGSAFDETREIARQTVVDVLKNVTINGQGPTIEGSNISFNIPQQPPASEAFFFQGIAIPRIPTIPTVQEIPQNTLLAQQEEKPRIQSIVIEPPSKIENRTEETPVEATTFKIPTIQQPTEAGIVETSIVEEPIPKIEQVVQPQKVQIEQNFKKTEEPETVFNLPPKIETPEIKIPLNGEIEKKESLPSVEIPKSEFFKIEQPKIDVPLVEQPQIDVPFVEQPKTDVPPVKQINVEIPKIDTPNIEQPKVEQSKVELQISELSKPQELPQKIQNPEELKLSVETTPQQISEIVTEAPTPPSEVTATGTQGAPNEPVREKQPPTEAVLEISGLEKTFKEIESLNLPKETEAAFKKVALRLEEAEPESSSDLRKIFREEGLQTTQRSWSNFIDPQTVQDIVEQRKEAKEKFEQISSLPELKDANLEKVKDYYDGNTPFPPLVPINVCINGESKLYLIPAFGPY